MIFVASTGSACRDRTDAADEDHGLPVNRRVVDTENKDVAGRILLDSDVVIQRIAENKEHATRDGHCDVTRRVLARFERFAIQARGEVRLGAHTFPL